jgi:hypothetical protein
MPGRDDLHHDQGQHLRPNSGGVYTGSSGKDLMYRYDIAPDTWTELPTLPAAHDNNSSCVVSQDGWLYYPTNNGGQQFYRLQLGVVP